MIIQITNANNVVIFIYSIILILIIILLNIKFHRYSLEKKEKLYNM